MRFWITKNSEVPLRTQLVRQVIADSSGAELKQLFGETA